MDGAACPRFLSGLQRRIGSALTTWLRALPSRKATQQPRHSNLDTRLARQHYLGTTIPTWVPPPRCRGVFFLLLLLNALLWHSTRSSFHMGEPRMAHGSATLLGSLSRPNLRPDIASPSATQPTAHTGTPVREARLARVLRRRAGAKAVGRPLSMKGRKGARKREPPPASASASSAAVDA